MRPPLPECARSRLCTFRIFSNRPDCGGMYRPPEHPKGFHEERYRRLLDKLVAARKAANLSQVDLAQALGRKQPFVSRYETGERRLDVVEFTDIAATLKLDPAALVEG